MRVKDGVRRWLVIPDAHVPYHDRAAWSCVLQAIKIVKPDGFICLGDIAEAESVNHWQWKRRKRPPLDTQLQYAIDPEIVVINKCMDELDEAVDKAGIKNKVFCQGNHDAWFDLLVEENPHLATTRTPVGVGYGFKDMLNLSKRGYLYKELHDMYKVGKLHFYHGSLCRRSINHCRWHCLNFGANIMYAHNHSIEEASISQLDGPKAAWSIGCLKDFRHEKGNEWLQRRPTSWGHAFALVDFFGDGLFTVHLMRIINGKCSLWGKVINGNTK